MSELHKPTIAILASGGGTTAEAFIHATQDGRVNAEVGLVVCNNPPERAGVWERVARLNDHYGLSIERVVINGRTHPDPTDAPAGRGQTLAESEAIRELVHAGQFSLVALMGYMKAVRGGLLEEYGWQAGYTSPYQARMLNTHPAPLPETADTYGLHASERVLELGLPYSKHTVHVVAKTIDAGPVIAEHLVEIMPGDTPQDVFDRVQETEKWELPLDIAAFLDLQAAYNAAN